MTEANLITPFTMSKVAKVHPFITLFALFLFGSLFGFIGMLLALPLVMLLWTLFQVFWVEGAIDTDHDRIAPVVEESRTTTPTSQLDRSRNAAASKP